VTGRQHQADPSVKLNGLCTSPLCPKLFRQQPRAIVVLQRAKRDNLGSRSRRTCLSKTDNRYSRGLVLAGNKIPLNGKKLRAVAHRTNIFGLDKEKQRSDTRVPESTSPPWLLRKIEDQ